MVNIDFDKIENDLRVHGLDVSTRIRLMLPNAKEILHAMMNHFIGESFEWIAEYDQVADWLTDNQYRGLLLFGLNGNGKTVLCQRALPAIFLEYHRKVMSCYDYENMNANAEEVLKRKILSIDDFGNEEQGFAFGNKRWVLPEVMDLAEKRGNLVVLSTNFGKEQIIEKYGVRTFERMISTTRRVEFKHESFRK